MSGVVIVHDYLTQRGGAERVVLELARTFPKARIVTSLYEPKSTYPEFADFTIEVFPMNRFKTLRKDARWALPLLPMAFRKHLISDADVVIISSSGFAHGIRSTAPKIVYCHNTARWIYQTEEYLSSGHPVVNLGARMLKPVLRRLDQSAARSVTLYLANSQNVQKRLAAFYGIHADVLYPPVNMSADEPMEALEGIEPGFALTVARPRSYKNTSAVTEAFELLNHHRLVVVGNHPGPGPYDNVLNVGRVSDAQLRWLYANCSMLVAGATEDFGLTPLEANIFGRPAVALRAGGYLESINEGVNGIFFDELNEQEIAAAIRRASEIDWDRDAIKAHAELFSTAAFSLRLNEAVKSVTPPSSDATSDRVPRRARKGIPSVVSK